MAQFDQQVAQDGRYRETAQDFIAPPTRFNSSRKVFSCHRQDAFGEDVVDKLPSSRCLEELSASFQPERVMNHLEEVSGTQESPTVPTHPVEHPSTSGAQTRHPLRQDTCCVLTVVLPDRSSYLILFSLIATIQNDPGDLHGADLPKVNDSIFTKLMLIVVRDGRTFATFSEEHEPQIVLSDDEEFTSSWLLERHLDEYPTHWRDHIRRYEVRQENDTNDIMIRGGQTQAQIDSNLFTHQHDKAKNVMNMVTRALNALDGRARGPGLTKLVPPCHHLFSEIGRLYTW